jgi:anti-anti-sigma factor
MRFRPEPFRCDVKEGRASAVVELHGPLDLDTVPRARAALDSVLSKPSVTLDLRGVAFMDSSGLRLILQIDALARQDGFNFFVVRGTAKVQQLFEITRMDQHLAFLDAPEDVVPPA